MIGELESLARRAAHAFRFSPWTYACASPTAWVRRVLSTAALYAALRGVSTPQTNVCAGLLPRCASLPHMSMLSARKAFQLEAATRPKTVMGLPQQRRRHGTPHRPCSPSQGPCRGLRGLGWRRGSAGLRGPWRATASAARFLDLLSGMQSSKYFRPHPPPRVGPKVGPRLEVFNLFNNFNGIWRMGWDSNPRTVARRWFSRPVP